MIKKYRLPMLDVLLLILIVLLLLAALQTAQICELSEEVEKVKEQHVSIVEQRTWIEEQIAEQELRTVEISAMTQVGPAPQFAPLPMIDLSLDLQQYTWNLCQQYEVPFEVVIALMWRESRFQVDAVGYNRNGTQDSGIMQINDINKEWLLEDYGITDLLNPQECIEAGIIILSMYWHKFTPEEAITAYGWGESGMLKYGVSDSAVLLLDKAEEYAH